MRYWGIISFLGIFACTAGEEPSPNTEADDPTAINQPSDGSDTNTPDDLSDASDATDPADASDAIDSEETNTAPSDAVEPQETEPAIPDLEVPPLLPPEEVELPECLQGESPTGCHGELEFSNWECPEGWEAEENPSPTYTSCKAPIIPECTGATMPVVGEVECQPIQLGCADGGWLVPSEQAYVLYVHPYGQPLGNNGAGWGLEYTDPAANISTALQVAAFYRDEYGYDVFDYILVAQGEYVEQLYIDVNITILGSCLEDTKVSLGVSSSEYAAVSIAPSTTSGIKAIKNITIEGPTHGIDIDSASSDVIIENVLIDGALKAGILAQNANSVSIRDVMIRDMAELPNDLSFGIGSEVEQLSLDRVTVQGARFVGINLLGGETLANQVSILNTAKDTNADTGIGGLGIMVTDGQFTANELVVSGASYVGIRADGESLLSLTDVKLDNISDGLPGLAEEDEPTALLARGGSAVTANRLSIERSAGAGIGADGSQTSLTINQAKISRIASSDHGYDGYGVQASGGAAVTLSQVEIQRSTSAGVLVQGTDTSMEIDNVTVSATRASQLAIDEFENGGDGVEIDEFETSPRGEGIIVAQGAQLEANQVRISDSNSLGIMVTDENTNVSMTRVEIIGAFNNTALTGKSFGASAALGATLNLNQVTVREAIRGGMKFADANTTANISEALVTETRSASDVDLDSLAMGMGMVAMRGANVQLAKAVLEHNVYAGILVQHEETQLNAENVVVRQTYPGQLENHGGAGLLFMGGNATINKAYVVENHHSGVLATAGIYGEESQPSIVSLSNTVIEQTKGLDLPGLGMGLVARHYSQVTVTQSRIANNRSVGVWSVQGSQVSLESVSVHATHTDEITGQLGIGVQAAAAGQVEIIQSYITGNERSAVQSYGAETSIVILESMIAGANISIDEFEQGGPNVEIDEFEQEAGEVEIDEFEEEEGETAIDEFEEEGSVEIDEFESVEMGGDGLAALFGGFISATRSVIIGHQRAGILIQDDENIGIGSAAEVEEVEILNNGLGICIASDIFEVESAFSEVRNENNEVESSSAIQEVEAPFSVESQAFSAVENAAASLAAVE
jgi:hypothetical protein